MSLQNARFVSKADINDINEADAVVFLAGVVAAFEDAEIDQRRCFETEALEDRHPKFLGGVLDAFLGEGKLQLGYADHIIILTLILMFIFRTVRSEPCHKPLIEGVACQDS